MLQSNQQAMHCFLSHQASACTDISGFGLLGHLLEMIKEQTVSIDIFLEAIPVLDGVLSCVESGFNSSLEPANRQMDSQIQNNNSAVQHPHYPLLFDPQTSGGLLASVPADKSEACLEELKNRGYDDARIIGHVKNETDPDKPIQLVTDS